MKFTSGVSLSVLLRVVALSAVVGMAGCANTADDSDYSAMYATPTVDYVEGLDVYSAPHKDSFLNQLAMNYRSYAIYNTRSSGYPDIGELFANKAVSAFAGEVPFPETLDTWQIEDDATAYELNSAYNEMIELLQNDAAQTHPELAAEMQAKYDCWISAEASGQPGTARECRLRFRKALGALRDCKSARIISATGTTDVDTSVTTVTAVTSEPVGATVGEYYPETAVLSAMRGANRTRDGVIIVNNVNIPEHLIRTEPVQPMVFNQHIYDNSGSNSNNVSNSGNSMVAAGCPCEKQQAQPVEPAPQFYGAPVAYEVPPVEECHCDEEEVEDITIVADNLVSRREFIDMMMAMRSELAAINARLDKLQTCGRGQDCDETTVIKVQQIPVEPKQHVMEEVFEIRFDFNKAVIKPEYEDIIRKLVDVTQSNKNVRISVVGHTDTVGSKNYNYALGGRRADAVQKMLIEYGIPSSQIVAVSAGEEDLKVPTPDGVRNAENRRVRVVKEVSYTEPAEMMPVANVEIESFAGDCDGYGCEK
jgi:outer membrane protein OmpA-like peptidoglycan-associated protein